MKCDLCAARKYIYSTDCNGCTARRIARSLPQHQEQMAKNHAAKIGKQGSKEFLKLIDDEVKIETEKIK